MKKLIDSTEIIALLREEGMLTRQEIAKKLGISMPTALQRTNELLELGILVEAAELTSTGGRKAKCLWLNKDIKKSMGIDIGLNHVKLVLTDFCGDYIGEKRLNLVFEDTVEWYHELKTEIDTFMEDMKVKQEDILCAGLSFPGIIDEEKGLIVKSHILGVENLGLDRFQSAIPFPVTVDNDANCASFAELTKDKGTFLYLSLNESVGGGIVLEGNLYKGATLQAGEIGHMILVPGGKTCYCGKKGCADAYLSPKVLWNSHENMEGFFARLEAGDTDAAESWNQYLDYLAVFTTNLRMMMNIELMIGGDVGKNIDPYMDNLKEKMQQYDLFARTIDYISPCSVKKSVCAIGAARIALRKYEADVIS